MKKNKLSLAVIALFVTFLSVSMTFAASDNILSANIKEADGTSGQNTNAGSGVKTGHIQDGAVTTGKILDGAATALKIADGAVTDGKITGPISTSKLNIGIAAGTVAAGDHNHDGKYQKKYANVIVVAKSGGDFNDPVSAINSISDASATNPYLIKIMPGVYDIGVTLEIKEFVNIEGSGEAATKIVGSAHYGSVNSDNKVEIRLLTFTGSVWITDSANISFADMSFESWVRCGAIGTSYMKDSKMIGEYYNQQGCHSVLENVSITSSQFTAVQNNGSGSVIELSNVKLTGGYSYNILNSTSGWVLVKNSSLSGSPYYIRNIFNAVTYIATSYLAGSSWNESGALTCAGVYRANYDFLTNGCP